MFIRENRETDNVRVFESVSCTSVSVSCLFFLGLLVWTCALSLLNSAIVCACECVHVSFISWLIGRLHQEFSVHTLG